MTTWRTTTYSGLSSLVGILLMLSGSRASAQTLVRLPPVDVRQTESVGPYSVRQASYEKPLRTVAAGPESIPAPVPTPQPPFVPASDEGLAIDLPAAMALADRVNPEIGISRQAILEALARWKGARVLLLPSITGGANYHNHNGNLQRARGAILALPAEQSLYFGGGAKTVAAESVAFPGIRIFSHLGDALFEPLAARQQTAVRQFDASATFNSVLLNVCTGYVDLMAAEARLEVLRHSRRDAAETVRLTSNFARVGQGRQADADRMSTEAALIDSQIERTQEEVAVAAAELARLLNLDPSSRLHTPGGPVPILMLVDPSYSVNELLSVALERRPELAARSAQIAESEIRFRQERTRALFPTISVGFSAGSFGGGSNLVDPVFGRFAGRTDFDVLAFWTAQNLGVGNVALWRQRRAQQGEAIGARSRTLNTVRSEVAEAYALVTAGRREIDVSELRLAVAESGLQEEMRRIKSGQGLPIELLDNLTRAVEARQAMVTAVAGYDRAQFRLFVALGQPPTLALPNIEGAGGPKHE